MKTSGNSFYIGIKRVAKQFITSLFGSRNYHKFIIIGQQRTGSSLLANLLRSHPQMEVGGEPFRLLKGSSCRAVWESNFNKKLPWIKYTGFKLFYYHPEDSKDREVWDFIDKDPEIRIIHIKRSNMLRSYVSKLIAEKTGAWNSMQKGNEAKVLDKRITIDPKECLEEFEKIKSRESSCSKERFKDHDYMEMTYEEFVSDIPGKLNEVLQFLDVRKIEVKSKLKRQNPERLPELITNYSEVEAALLSSEFSYLLKM